jgi:ribosomal protein S18 acetylase RimI-like enzyme
MQQTTRRLVRDDIDRLTAIDSHYTGHARRRFFEKRLTAAGQQTGDFIPIGIERDGSLCGFAIARLLRGEFGHSREVAVLDAIGVDPGSQERGVGHALMQELVKETRQRGFNSLQSQAEWTNHPMVRFFEASGFTLAPRLILERSIEQAFDEPGEEV